MRVIRRGFAYGVMGGPCLSATSISVNVTRPACLPATSIYDNLSEVVTRLAFVFRHSNDILEGNSLRGSESEREKMSLRVF